MKFSVVTANGYVVEEEVAAPIATRGRDFLIQRESGTGVWAAVNDEHGGGCPLNITHCAVDDDFSKRLGVLGLGHALFPSGCSGGAACSSHSKG